MKKRRRRLTIASGAALLLLAFVLVSDDDPVVTEDPLAEDSDIARQVMSARGDSLVPIEKPVETSLAERVGEPLPVEPVADTSPSPVTAPSMTPVVVSAGTPPSPPSMAPVVVSAVTVPRAQEPRSQMPAPAPELRPAETRLAVVDRADVVPVSMNTSRTTRSPEKNEGSMRVGMISAGSELAVATDERTCLDGTGIGDTFPAVVMNPVSGSNGVVIPRGAQAVAQIASKGDWGAGLGVRIKSVKFDGRSHPVNSDVGYVTVERSREGNGVCIPRRGRIETFLKRPMRVAVSSPSA